MLLFSQAATADEIYVDGSVQQSGNGSSWPQAFKTVQEALDEAAQSQGAIDQIWVADGIYVPSVPLDIDDIDPEGSTNTCDSAARRKTFALIPGVSMFGGFQGNSHPSGGETLLTEADPATYLTILSGDLLGTEEEPQQQYIDDPENPSTYDDNAYHVLVYVREIDIQKQNCQEVTEPMVIDGFVITGGNASGGSLAGTCTGGQRNGAGGGAFIEYYSCEEFYPVGPRFSRCVFEHNFARIGGGGIAAKKAGTTILDCLFRHNHQTDSSPNNQTSTIATGGGAVSSVGKTTMIRSRFFENESEVIAGGVIAENNAKIIDCEFRAKELRN